VARAGNLVGGRYELLSEIGQGAMGSVWKAVHRTLGRPFAIKFLKPYDLDIERQQERFLQEARLAAAVSHRFVVDIVDYGMTDEATPYLVMEYLQGESLGARMRRAPPMSVRELLRVLAEALLGLEAVHQAGVIHRDVKPENILLVPEAGGVIPKLVDFSISRSEIGDTPPESGAVRTSPGTTVGTPWYMAPEQANGLVDVRRQADLYSVGVILYEALTGVMPFDGPDIDAVLLAVVTGRPQPIAELRPELPAELDAVVETAMRHDPSERYASAADMAAALYALVPRVAEPLACADLSARPRRPSDTALAHPPAPPERTMIVTRRTRGRRDTVAILGLCALAAVVLLANHYFSALEARAALPRVESVATAPLAEEAPPPAPPVASPPVTDLPAAEPAHRMGAPEAPRRARASRRADRPRPPPDLMRDPGF
jgi:eukaryotic-like serine/threonine-protein kinase